MVIARANANRFPGQSLLWPVRDAQTHDRV